MKRSEGARTGERRIQILATFHVVNEALGEGDWAKRVEHEACVESLLSPGATDPTLAALLHSCRERNNCFPCSVAKHPVLKSSNPFVALRKNSLKIFVKLHEYFFVIR